MGSTAYFTMCKVILLHITDTKSKVYTYLTVSYSTLLEMYELQT